MDNHSVSIIRTNKVPLIILINVEIIEQSVVNKFDQQRHILVEKKDQNIFLVIKNKSRLVGLFDMIENIVRSKQNQHKKQSMSQVLIVSYSSKPVNSTYQRFSKVNKYVADKMYYFDLSPKLHSTVRPNRAFINKNNLKGLNVITYGEGYSQINSKQQLRLAIQCVFNLYGQNDKFFIIQTQKGLKQEEKQLKKQGFKYLWTIENFDQNQSFSTTLQKIIEAEKQQQYHLKNKMEEQTLQNSCYLKMLKSKLKEEQFKQITSNVVNNNANNQILEYLDPIKLISQFLSKPKKSYTPTPKSTIRSPGSKQICSLIFKNVGDHKLWIAKSSTPKDIGGLYYEEKIQNRCFISMITNLFTKVGQKKQPNVFYSLPLEKSYCMMKYSLLKPYDTKKACVIVKPYLQNLKCLQSHAQQFLQILKKQNSVIKGFGQMIFWSLISGESFRTKTLLQQLSVLGIQEMISEKDLKDSKQSNYLTQNYQSLKQFITSNKLNKVNLLRLDYYQPFSTSSQFNSFFSQQQNDLFISLTRNLSISLSDLNNDYLEEIYELTTLITGDEQKNKQNMSIIGYEIIKGIGRHYKWEYDKSEIIDCLFNRAKKLQSYTKNILISRNKIIEEQKIQKSKLLTTYKNLQQNFITQLQKQNPLSLLLFISNDYARFIKPPSPQQSYFSQFYPKMDQQKQNKYVTALIQKTHSFQIYGNCPPIYSLPNWVRSLGLKYRFIEYISMLTHTKEDFILIGKRLKIMSTNQKNNALLIVDHCEICEEILDEAKTVRTIFISRFKKGQHQMQVIYQQQNESKQSKYLQDSNDELVSMLMQIYEKYIMKQQQKSYLFKRYFFVLQNYIRIKCQQYNFSYNKVRQFCLQLHKNITQSKNRYKQIQQRYKTNNQWRLLYLLPIEKKNQKVTFIKNLHSFIQVLKFIQLIREEKQKQKCSISMNIQNTNCNKILLRINAKLLPCLKEWQKFIQPEIKNEIISFLLSQIQQLKQISINNYLKQQKQVDNFSVMLQVLQTLLSPYKDLQNKIINQQQHNLFYKQHKLYYRIFPQQLALYHFPDQQIRNLTKLTEHSYLIETDKKLVIYQFNFQQQKCEKIFQIEGEYRLMRSIIGCMHRQVQNKLQKDDYNILRLPIKQITSQQIRVLQYDIQKGIIKQNQTNNKQIIIRQIQLTVTIKGQKQIIVAYNKSLINTLQKKQQLRLFVQNISIDQEILHVVIIPSRREQQNMNNNNKNDNVLRQKYKLVIVTSYHILVYGIQVQFDLSKNQIQIRFDKNSNQNQYNKIYSVNKMQNKVNKQFQIQTSYQYRYKFISLFNYNNQQLRFSQQQSNKSIDKYQTTKKTITKTFNFIINLQLQSKSSILINKSNNLYSNYCLSIQNNNNDNDNYRSPILRIDDEKRLIVLLVVVVQQSVMANDIVIENKQQIVNVNVNDPFIVVVDLLQSLPQQQQTNNLSIIPLFNTTNIYNQTQATKQIYQRKSICKIIHSINISINNTLINNNDISLNVYYSLVDYCQTHQHMIQQVLVHVPKIVNTVSLLYSLQDLKHINKHQNIKNQNILNYTKPQLHLFHNLSSSNHILPIINLQQNQSQLKYILTLQQSLKQNHSTQNHLYSCIRIWKLYSNNSFKLINQQQQ